MTAPQLATATGKDASNTKKAADDMTGAGLLERLDAPERSNGGPGRPAASAYALADGQKDALERFLASATLPGTVGRGQQLVYAEAPGPKINDFFDVMANAAAASRASWSAQCDGAHQGFLIAFDDDDAAVSAVDLMAELTAAEILCSRTVISQVGSGHDLVKRAKSNARTARNVGMRHRLRHPNPAVTPAP
ncbi:MAG TPA: hypothetical protein VEX36_11760 [Thermoleophilaceae bacterium]|nr:hypothetical protein [Thermoleophilaceae bacterium]